MKRTAIVLPWASLLAMTSIAWACDSTPQSSAKSACPVAAKKAKTEVVSKTCPSPGASCCAAMAAAAAAKTATAKTETVAPSQAGMRAYLDPETGLLSPVPVTDADKAAAQQPVTEDLREPVQTVLPDGSVMIELNGHGQEYFMINIDKDGNRTTQCVQDPKAAAKAPVKSAKPEDK